MSQPSPQVSQLYSTLSSTGPSHPMIQVTPNGVGHTLRVESAHGLGHPTEWVAVGMLFHVIVITQWNSILKFYNILQDHQT